MSDPKSYGEPVEEPTAVDDVVGSAQANLADAEAAGRDAVGDEQTRDAAASAPADAEQVAPVSEPTAEPVVSEPVVEPAAAEPLDGRAAEPVDEAPSAANEWAAEPPAWAAQAEAAEAAAAARETESDAADAAAPAEPTHVAHESAAHAAYDDQAKTYDTAVTASEPASEHPAESAGPIAPVAPAAVAGAAAGAGTAAAPSYGQPIFVQAPEAPRPRGNRAAAGAIGLLAAIAFAVLYLAVWLAVGAFTGDVTAGNVGTVALEALATWTLWVPTVVFFLAFWLVGAIINRGRWGVWVHVGLLVGLAAYGGYLLGQLFQAPFWTLTPSEGADLVQGELLAPLAVASFVIARELTIWFGAWVAARGRRVTELNVEAQREYERTLEAGPQLTHL